MTSTVTRVDYATARVRLEAVTSDREVIAGFERLVVTATLTTPSLRLCAEPA